MAIMVKCEICGKILILQQKPKYFYKHCGISQIFSNDKIIREGFTYDKKQAKNVVTDKEKIEVEFI